MNRITINTKEELINHLKFDFDKKRQSSSFTIYDCNITINIDIIDIIQKYLQLNNRTIHPSNEQIISLTNVTFKNIELRHSFINKFIFTDIEVCGEMIFDSTESDVIINNVKVNDLKFINAPTYINSIDYIEFTNLHISNTIISHKIFIENKTISILVFEKCTFQQEVSLIGTKCQYVYFTSSTFDSTCNFNYSNWKEVLWADTTFANVSIHSAYFIKNMQFNNITIEHLDITSSSVYYFKIDRCQFNSLKGIFSSLRQVEWYDLYVHSTTNLQQSKICSSIEYSSDISNCTFIEETNFNCTEFRNTTFKDVTFKKEVGFKNSKFTNLTFLFVECEDTINFKNSTFDGMIKFRYSAFHKNFGLWNVGISNTFKLHNARLISSSNIYFGESQNEDYIKRNDKTNSNIEITDTVINGRLDFNRDKIKSLSLKGSTIIGTLNRIDFNPEIIDWQTATILKHEELNRHNNIMALEYKAKEQELYREELSKKQGVQKFFEKYSLLLSKISNNHGQNWGQAILFTILSWFVTFFIFRMPVVWQWDYWCDVFMSRSFWADFIRFFNPTNYELLAIYIQNDPVHPFVKFLGIIIFMIGKILIPYGVYEVIQAFRKFNKVD